MLAPLGAMAVAGQSGDIDRQLERAGRLFEMGQRNGGEAGSRLSEMAAYREAIALAFIARPA